MDISFIDDENADFSRGISGEGFPAEGGLGQLDKNSEFPLFLSVRSQNRVFPAKYAEWRRISTANPEPAACPEHTFHNMFGFYRKFYNQENIQEILHDSCK